MQEFTEPSFVRPPDLRLSAPGSLQALNRQRMLERVHALWITGSQAHLPNLFTRNETASELLRVDLSTRSGTNQPSTIPLPGSHLADAYDKVTGDLLILGERGSGKTTLLLQLASHLLDRAMYDDHAPIPVLFNLGSWTTKYHSLDAWLTEELRRQYQVSGKVAQTWLKQHALLPLLDGLDQVEPDALDACLRALYSDSRNAQKEPLVLCCRQEIYHILSERLLIRKAAHISMAHIAPLTPKHVEDYCMRVGGPFARTSHLLQAYPHLGALVTTPLTLCLLTLTAENPSLTMVLQATDPATLQRQLLVAYTEQQLTIPAERPERLSQHDQRHWLTILAQHMQRLHQPIFLLDDLQPIWLARKARIRYNLLFILSALGLMVLFTLFYVFLLAPQILTDFALVSPSMGMSIFWILGGVLLLVVLLVVFFAWPRTIELAPVPFWSQRRSHTARWLFHLAVILVFLTIGVLGASLGGNASGGQWLSYVLGSVVALGTSADDTLAPDFSLVPGEKARQSLWTSLLSVLTIMLCLCSVVVGMTVLVKIIEFLAHVPPSRHAVGDLILGAWRITPVVMIGAWLRGGGSAWLKHLALRRFLQRHGLLPRKITTFLEEAANRRLLQRVGPGYLFVHPLVQDYFTQQERDSHNAETSRAHPEG